MTPAKVEDIAQLFAREGFGKAAVEGKSVSNLTECKTLCIDETKYTSFERSSGPHEVAGQDEIVPGGDRKWDHTASKVDQPHSFQKQEATSKKSRSARSIFGRLPCR